ncbi:MAG: hypothetical protein CSB44_08780 [Gammaproteobacteria bacterium]|nr:MAG: hypothetical protein CSB44_08780 [Gammaproteobacteria bacterium]PIE37017.1 MAG: hypothetical protein CSA54_02375 [Gammaproteobacteria bacterium]
MSTYTAGEQQGFSLVELMVAMVIGLMLIGGMVTVFHGHRRSAELNSSLATLQEYGRFALDGMVRDVRMAGFQGCTDASVAATILADDPPTTDFVESAISAAVVGSASWDPGLPPGFTAPTSTGVPVAGTHALIVQFGNPEINAIKPMATAGHDIVVKGDAPRIATGDYALVSNCQVADIFKVTAVSGKTIKHGAAGNSGSNLLSAPYGQSPTEDAMVTRFESNIYYIGNTGRTDSSGNAVLSLYRQSLPYTNAPIEMVEGVTNLRIRLGFRDRTAGGAIEFVTPDDADTADGRVEAVQIGLLLRSRERLSDQDDKRSFNLAGDTISAAASENAMDNTYASDRHLRLAFNASVSVRNRP